MVPIRSASLTKAQKGTLEKYGNRAAKSGKKGDFLSNARNAHQGKAGAKKPGKVLRIAQFKRIVYNTNNKIILFIQTTHIAFFLHIFIATIPLGT